jgi:DNA-binding transcriptional LysR family regulator
MKLSALQALVLAVQSGSLRAAARALGLSQPALSKAIRELELELAAPLLVRTSTGVVPTAQGRVLVERARLATRELQAARDEIRQLGGQMQGELAIAAVPVALMLLMPQALRTFGRAYPGIRLRVSEELYIAQLQRLRAREVDIAVGGIPDGLASGEFVTEALMRTTMVVVVRKGSARARARQLAQLADAQWVYTGGLGSGPNNDAGYALQLFEQHGLPPPPAGVVVNSTLSLLALLGAGDYVGLLPRELAQHPLAAPYLSIVPIAEEGLPLTIGAIVRSDAVVTPAVRHFIAHLHRAAHQLARA